MMESDDSPCFDAKAANIHTHTRLYTFLMRMFTKAHGRKRNACTHIVLKYRSISTLRHRFLINGITLSSITLTQANAPNRQFAHPSTHTKHIGIYAHCLHSKQLIDEWMATNELK